MKHERKISVIGIGYVGLPVAVAFAHLDKVIGFDINNARIAELESGVDKTNEVTPENLKKANIIFTSDPNDAIGTHIASKVVKALIKKGVKVDQAIVTVLGLTFKEDVPDIRNSRVIDIISELREYGIQVQVHDSFAETKDVEKEYRITPQNLSELQPAHAVVLAVSHEDYVSGGWDFISGLLLEKEGVVYDVKGILDRSSKPENIYLERL